MPKGATVILTIQNMNIFGKCNMKKVVIIFFTVLIVASAIFINGIFIDENAQDDVFGDTFTTFFQVLLNIFVLVPEIDWFYNVLYFLSDKKEKYKTKINVVSCICSIAMVVSLVLIDSFLLLGELLMILSFIIFVLLRLIYVIVSLTILKK